MDYDEERVKRTGAPLPEDLTGWPGFTLAWAADEAGRLYAGMLATLGIKPQHLGVLTLLEAEGPMVQARIGDRLSIVKPAVVGLLNELEAMNLVERRPHPTDRRAFEVHLLEAGKQRVREAEDVSRRATEVFFAELEPEELRALHEMLTRLAGASALRRTERADVKQEENE